MEAIRRREVSALFVIAPAGGARVSALLTAVRKAGHGQPQVIAVDEAAAIAKRFPELETSDVPKGSFDGSLPVPTTTSRPYP